MTLKDSKSFYVQNCIKTLISGICDAQKADDDENQKCSRAEDDLLVENQRDEEAESNAINEKNYCEEYVYHDTWIHHEVYEDRAVLQAK